MLVEKETGKHESDDASMDSSLKQAWVERSSSPDRMGTDDEEDFEETRSRPLVGQSARVGGGVVCAPICGRRRSARAKGDVVLALVG